MPISATGNKKAQRGFTLVEVLTVVVILGLMAGIVVLSMPPADDEARAEAYGFAARLQAAQDLAVTGGVLTGLVADTRSYGFVAWRDGAWLPADLPGQDTAEITLEEAVVLELTVDEAALAGTAGGDRRFVLGSRNAEAPPPEPVMLFYPAGEISAFSARFDGQARDWLVTGDETGRISVVPADG